MHPPWQHAHPCTRQLTLGKSLPPPLPAALEACPGGAAAGEASPAIAKRLHELLATVAMQFGGYIFRLSESQASAGLGCRGDCPADLH